METNWDNFRKFINPIIIQIFNLEFVKITMDEKFVGIGIRIHKQEN